MKPINVPVIMWHSVLTRRQGWCYEFLSELSKEFERKLAYLKAQGYRTISLYDLYHYMSARKSIPSRSIVFTFDDGYLDNWVVVYPLLRKYGFTGVVFVNGDFVDPTDQCRYNLDDLMAGKCSRQDVQELGFLSWAEMREMERTGVIDIQSHSLTHTWYFRSSVIVDFHHPGDQSRYPWLAWNARPDQQYRWMTENQESFVPFGTPVYEFGRSLGIRRYLDDTGLKDILIDHVQRIGAERFFQIPDWRANLFSVASRFREIHADRGRFETQAEYEQRVRHELSQNKRILEENLGKTVEFLCWPGGAYTETALRIARECGYLASTVKEGRNSVGNDPSKINRISSGNPDRADEFPWRHKILTFAFYLERFRGNGFCKLVDRIYRLK